MHLSIDTVLPADSVEFCPHPEASDIFVCGTYNLEDQQSDQATSQSPAAQIRRGQCLVFEAHSENSEDISVSKTQEISLPAVLDLKWCHTEPSRQPILAVADSEGNVNLFEWSLQQKQLCNASSLRVAPSHVLCLSLDWSERRAPTSTASSLVVSLSDGKLTLLEPDQTVLGLPTLTEPWCVAWNYWDTNVIYSGGFDAGVTSIQSHPNIEHLIAVGSYDCTVRLFDTRKPLIPLAQAGVGGGAWRVKWHPSPSRNCDLLVAAMHNGFKILSFHDIGDKPRRHSDGSNENWEVQKRYDGHASLAYGVDWSYQSWQDQTLVASASFYDHALHLWRG
ncbi:WD40-repeat-containing domain protein [Lactarius vividus]|nr:WD40-repeat-containing domain protein [Lactarius vividus]